MSDRGSLSRVKGGRLGSGRQRSLPGRSRRDRRAVAEDLRITHFLAELSDALRPLADPDAITERAAAMVREVLGVAGCAYAEVQADEDQFVVPSAADAPDSSPRISLTTSSFGREALAKLRRNEPFVVTDASRDPRLGEADRKVYREMGVGSAIAAPLQKEGRFAAIVAVYERTPRRWTPEEVELVCAVAARCWESIERARAIRELRQSEQRLRFAQRAGRVGVFEWEIANDRVIWSPELEGLYDLEEGAFSGGFEEWCARLVPEDGERIRHEAKEALAARREEFSIEFRAILDDGVTKWLALQARISYSEGGRPIRMIGVNIDIEDRKRAERDRELLLSQTLAARAEAEEANRARSAFLANMSHELRTPINAISGYAELMALGITGPVSEKQRSYLERIRISGDHLLTLVNEVLDLARVESGRLMVARDRLIVSDVVREALDMLGADAASHRVALVDAVEDTDEFVLRGDRDRVRQILVNLVSNAVKFTPEGGRVTISAAEVSSSAEANPADAEEGVGQGGRWLRLDVTDTGIGVPPEERQRIFAPFYQVDSAYNRRNEGTGLGLSISRQLARRMGGDLTLRSTDGRGSRFSLWLPVAGPEEPEERVEWRPGVHDDLQLAAVGQALIRSAAAIVSHLEERLRHDAGIENARDLVTAQLADHIVTFLAAMGVALVTLDEANGDPELMRDGAEIQRTIARLHGAQRGRLGWTEEDIHREFDLLREITRETLARRLDDEADAALDEAIGVVGRLLDQAEQQSIRGRSRALQERS